MEEMQGPTQGKETGSVTEGSVNVFQRGKPEMTSPLAPGRGSEPGSRAGENKIRESLPRMSTIKCGIRNGRVVGEGVLPHQNHMTPTLRIPLIPMTHILQKHLAHAQNEERNVSELLAKRAAKRNQRRRRHEGCSVSLLYCSSTYSSYLTLKLTCMYAPE